MAGPTPLYQPTFSAAQIAACQALTRQQSAPQARVYRAKLALLLHAAPGRDKVALGSQLGRHANGVRYWRKIRATEGSRLADRGGQGRKPAFPVGCQNSSNPASSGEQRPLAVAFCGMIGQVGAPDAAVRLVFSWFLRVGRGNSVCALLKPMNHPVFPSRWV